MTRNRTKISQSPSGSPRYPSSPNAARRVNTVSRSSPTGFHDKNPALRPSSIPIATKSATDTKTINRNPTHHKQQTLNSDDDSDADTEEEGDQHLKDVRNSIGFVLSKTKSSEEILKDASTSDPITSKFKEEESLDRPVAEKEPIKQHKQKKRHRYIVYGDTGLSPGYLTPPTEPRGSIDLSAEMEIWKRQERRKFEDLGKRYSYS